MEGLKISIAGAVASVTENTLLTAGMVGLPVSFTFDDRWDGLGKTGVFRAGGKTVSCPEMEEEMTVPWEVMEKSGCTLYIGVYGCNRDGSVVIPTLWAQVGVIQPGADPEADPGMAPNLPMWMENQAIALQAMAVAESVRQDADAGAFQGAMGPAPVRGVDYWTQADKNEIRAYVDSAILGGAW